jgi:hypothetical protein
MEGFDFEEDLRKIIINFFFRNGIKFGKKNDIEDLLFDFHSILKKLVSITPRRVYYSTGLLKKIDTLPSKPIIKRLEQLFAIGGNVNCFQSKKLLQTNFHDHLVYEWNIYHFHLSERRGASKPFVKQSNLLLFVYVTESMAIFLDVDKHRQGLFAEEKWIEILHDDFPELIKQYLMSNIHSVYPKTNSEERQKLWDKGYTIGLIKIRENVYMSPGLGRSSSGHSMMVVTEVGEVQRWLNTITNQFKTNISQICDYFKIQENMARFFLTIGEKHYAIYEKNLGIQIIQYPAIFDFNL